MLKPLKMLDPKKMVELILQSVEKSDLFRSDLDRDFVKIVLDMYLTKGDFPHFVEYYGNKVDRNDFETYFKSTVVKMFDENFYNEFVEEYYGD
jgi:hypothetical protein